MHTRPDNSCLSKLFNAYGCPHCSVPIAEYGMSLYAILAMPLVKPKVSTTLTAGAVETETMY